MVISSLSELAPTEIRAVVINVRTDLVTTLALASIRAHADCPILVINCDAGKASETYFNYLSDAWGFDVMAWPARPHGIALDQLFTESPDTYLWLVDSDAEILNDKEFIRIRDDLKSVEGVFGAGYVHGPGWLGAGEKVGDGNVLYQGRPWIPSSGFNVSHIRDGIENGVSFIDRSADNPLEFYLIRFGQNNNDQMEVNGVYCDTGADMYQWQRLVRGRVWCGNSVAINDTVNHYHGVTRLFLAPAQTNGARLLEITNEIKEKLAKYDVDFDRLAAAAVSASI